MTLLLDEVLLVADAINGEVEAGARLELPERSRLAGLDASLDSMFDQLDGSADPSTKAAIVFCATLSTRPLEKGSAWLAVTLATLVLEEHGLTLTMSWIELYSLAEVVLIEGRDYPFHALVQVIDGMFAYRSRPSK